MRSLIGRLLLIVAGYILFINLCIYLDILQVGGLVDGSGHSYWYFEYYYFGVQSFTNWLQDFPRSISNYNALASIIRLGQSISGISVVNAGNDFYQLLIGIIIGPFSFIWQIVLESIQLTQEVVLPLFTHIMKLFVGAYNLPVGAYPEISYPSTFITPVIL